jgi:hypothetical protein
MPKEFPQIRINADTDEAKQQAVGHVKRGMLELFKTQSYQELSGVPIAKRTVEVDPFTTITVQIAGEQTFVDITSTTVGAEFKEEKVEEERDANKCPAAFIIRKQDWEGHGISLNPGMVQTKGYIIAYNRSKDKWGIASFTAPDGDTFAHGSNLGWWHAKNKGNYTACDVITWNGQSNFDFAPPYVWPTAASGLDQITAMSRNFFFKGRMFSAPWGDVLGACIIDDGGTDYVYVHVMNSVNRVTNLNRRRMTSMQSHRMTVGALLSGSTDWEEVGEVVWEDFNITIGGSSTWFDYPRSTAYIDKDGFSYILLVSDQQQVDAFSSSGATFFTKFNLRDMSFEVLNDTQGTVPTEKWGGAWHWQQDVSGSGIFRHRKPGAWRTCWYQFENLNRPWIFHALGGTQNLWTYALEWDIRANSHSFGIDNDDFELDIDIVPQTGDMTGTVTLIIEKDGAEFERVVVWEATGASSMTWGWRNDDPDSDWLPGAGLSTKALFEHHPDIENSWRYGTFDISGGGAAVSIGFVEDGQAQVFASGTQGPLIPQNPPQVSSHQAIWYSPKPFDERILALSGHWNPGSTLDDGTMDKEEPEFVNLLVNDNYIWDRSIRLSSSLVPRERGTSGVFWPVTVGTRMDTGMYAEWGSSVGFVVPKKEGTEKAWFVESFAVHRPTDTKRGTKKPYLHLRRPIKNGTNAGKINWPRVGGTPGSENINAIRNARKHPATFDENIDDEFGQDTNDDRANGGGLFSRKEWWFWTEPVGHLLKEDFPPPDFESGDKGESDWDSEGWELKSNVLTAKQLNKLTNELDNVFFEIGVL